MKSGISSMVAAALVLSGCGTDAPNEPVTATPEIAESPEVVDEALPAIPPEPAPAREPLGLIIDVDQLQERLASSPPRVIDVRAEDAWAAAHVPGAVRVDLADWKATSLLPDGLDNPEHWSKRIGDLGINADSQVVVYGESPTNAARAWWILKYLGIWEVALLDGGWTAWQTSGAATDDQAVEVEPVEFAPRFQSERLARMQELQVEGGDATIIDTRTIAEFEGTGGPGERHGHIPGAVHLEWNEFVVEDGRFRSVDEIRALLAERGISDDGPQVVHCQTGGRASVAALALELAGFGPTQNYYCGWSEWSATEDAPVEAASDEP